MDLPRIVSATLGLSSPWQVSSVAFSDQGRRLEITVTYTAGQQGTCPRCGAAGAGCREVPETWFHQDFFRHPTYLHTKVPHIVCCGREHAIERPWTRPGSKFVKLSTSNGSE